MILLMMLIFNFCGCTNDIKTREEAIPDDAVKMSPETDLYPPQLHSDEYEDPIPLEGPVNTAGAEDSPFIPCCEEGTFYFFFTPDVRVPVEQQLLDGVTGIYMTQKTGNDWSEPERVVLQDQRKLALDGCAFVHENIMWFCSARQGYTGIHWFTADYVDGEWKNWENADFDPALDVGELHFSTDWTQLYYHSDRSGGRGGTDIWMSEYVDGEWQEPENIIAINTEENESMPYLTSDGNELWFNRWYLGTPAVFRSVKSNGEWKEPELIISQFAGEPTLDDQGNIYFVHHFFSETGDMIEADIYVVYRK